HPHPAFNSQGGDATHEHEHSHSGDAGHHHSHEGTGDHAARILAAAHGHEGACWDPDNDGDCDLTAAGDTDHDYWSAGGEQLKPVPGKPMGGAWQDEVRAIIREEMRVLGADKYKQDDRDRMAKAGQAMPDGSYPIADEEDLDNAI